MKMIILSLSFIFLIISVAGENGEEVNREFFYGDTKMGVFGDFHVVCTAPDNPPEMHTVFLPFGKCVHTRDPYFGFVKAIYEDDGYDNFDLLVRCKDKTCGTGCQTRSVPIFEVGSDECSDFEKCRTDCISNGACEIGYDFPLTNKTFIPYTTRPNQQEDNSQCFLYFVPRMSKWFSLQSTNENAGGYDVGRLFYHGHGCAVDQLALLERYYDEVQPGDENIPSDQGYIRDCLRIAHSSSPTEPLYFRSIGITSNLFPEAYHDVYLYDDLKTCMLNSITEPFNDTFQLTGLLNKAGWGNDECYNLYDIDMSFSPAYPYTYQCHGNWMESKDACSGSGDCLSTGECACEAGPYLYHPNCYQETKQFVAVLGLITAFYTVLACCVNILLGGLCVLFVCTPLGICGVLGVMACFSCCGFCCCCRPLLGGKNDLQEEIELLQSIREKKRRTRAGPGGAGSRKGTSSLSSRKAASIGWDQFDNRGGDGGDGEMPVFEIKRDLFVIEYEEVKLVRVIGQGGGGAVIYQGSWNASEVAVKLFKTQALSDEHDFTEFEREVKVMASISHPNILRFYGCLIKVPRVGIVMEFASKGDLERYLLSGGSSTYTSTTSSPSTTHKKDNDNNDNNDTPLDKNDDDDDNFDDPENGIKTVKFRDKVRIILGVSKGMAYLHERDIIHRDLKLQNVLMDENDIPKLIDFGLSRIINRNQNFQMTKRVGTSFFMAPEITLGGHYDEKIDVFSFGILLYMMVFTNFYPYGRDAEFNVEVQVASNPSFRPKIPLDSLFPEWVLVLMRKCWSSESSSRPSFEDIIQEVETHKDDTEGPDEIMQKQRIKVRELERKVEGLESDNKKIRDKILKKMRKKIILDGGGDDADAVGADNLVVKADLIPDEELELELFGEMPVPPPSSTNPLSKGTQELLGKGKDVLGEDSSGDDDDDEEEEEEESEDSDV